METEKNNINYLHVVQDSQFYDDLEQIKVSLESLLSRADPIGESHTYTGGSQYLVLYSKSLKEEIEYMIKGINNTIKQGYKLNKNED